MNKNDLFSLLMVIWAAMLVFLAWQTDIALFIILLLIGFLVVRELLDTSLTKETKDRMNFYLYLGMIVFLYVVFTKVVSILNS